MLGIFGTAAKKTAQALDIIEDDQPTVEEPVHETIGDLIEQQVQSSALPQKVGLVDPIIIDPQVIFERLTELFGVYKGTTTTYHMECDSCMDTWERSDAPSDWEDQVVCPCCDYEQEFAEAYDWKEILQTTSRTPTVDELKLVLGKEDQRFFNHNYHMQAMKLLFISLSGHEPVDGDGDTFGYDSSEPLFVHRNIKSLAECTQPQVWGDDADEF